MKDIICISTHYWNDFWFRKQHFMSRLNENGFRVFYVQPSYSMCRKTMQPALAKNKLLFPLTQKVDNNFYLFFPPRVLPKPNHQLSIKLSWLWTNILIAKVSKQIGIKDPILWIYNPYSIFGIKYIKYSKLVFDLTDDLAAYPNTKREYNYAKSCIDWLTFHSDLMIVTSPTLYQKYGIYSKNSVLIPNGFDSSLFHQLDTGLPEHMREIKRPIVGFIGVLFSHLDYDLIYEIVIKNPDKSFVFVGPVQNNSYDSVNKINSLNNSYFLGPKERHLIPDYVKNFDVCINPFKMNDVSRSVSPLKVYEYLACGKPVISIYMDGLAKDGVGKYINFVHNKKEFSLKINELLTNENSEKQLMRIEGVQPYSWDNLFHKLQKSLKLVFDSAR